MMNCEKQNQLLQLFREQSFALREIGLFLDTHPTDKEALRCYHKFRKLLCETEAKYVELYGSLTVKDVKSEECWTWVQAPWPWERQA